MTLINQLSIDADPGLAPVFPGQGIDGVTRQYTAAQIATLTSGSAFLAMAATDTISIEVTINGVPVKGQITLINFAALLGITLGTIASPDLTSGGIGDMGIGDGGIGGDGSSGSLSSGSIGDMGVGDGLIGN